MEKQRILKNGIKLCSYSSPSTHSFYISLFVKTGSMYESEDTSGISHLLEHVIIRNVNGLYDGRLYALLDEYGLELNASTYSEMVQFYISGAPRAFTLATEIISRLLSPIALSREDFEAEKRRIRAEIREGEDRTSLSQFTSETVFGGTSLALPITGTARSVSCISRRKIEEYRRRVFTRENTFLYVTGAFSDGDLDLLAHEVEKFEPSNGDEHTNTAPVSNYFGKRDATVAVKNADFCKVKFTFDIDMSRVSLPESDLAHAVLVGGYSSELFVELSEKRGLFYDVDGAAERYKNLGTLSFSFEVKEANLYEAVRLVCELLVKLKSEPLPPSRCMYASFVDNAPMLLDSPRELNFTFAYDNHVMGMGYPDVQSRAAAYSAVTPERLCRVFSEIFTTDNLTLTLKGNKKRIDTDRLRELILTV